MRKRLAFAAFCILSVPLLFSPSQGNKLVAPTPFGTVALAGHVIGGQWCDCGAPGCICDPGENPGGNSARRVSDESSDQGLSLIRARSNSGSDLGTGTLILALALFVWARLRA